MVSRASPTTSEAIVAMLRQVQLGVEHGYLDPSPYNEAGAAYFVHGPPGAEQRTLVMVRWESVCRWAGVRRGEGGCPLRGGGFSGEEGFVWGWCACLLMVKARFVMAWAGRTACHAGVVARGARHLA